MHMQVHLTINVNEGLNKGQCSSDVCSTNFGVAILCGSMHAWAPHTKCGIERLQAAQSRAARFVMSDYGRHYFHSI